LDAASIEVGAVEFGDRRCCFFVVRERDKAEAARAAGLTVEGNHDVGHAATLSEEIAKRIIGAAEGEIPHIEFVTHTIFSFCCAFLPGSKRSDHFPWTSRCLRGNSRTNTQPVGYALLT